MFLWYLYFLLSIRVVILWAVISNRCITFVWNNFYTLWSLLVIKQLIVCMFCIYESVNKKIAGKKKHDKNTPKTMIHKYLQRTLRIENHVCFVDRCLSFCPFAFGHCVVWPSIYGFWLRLYAYIGYVNLVTKNRGHMALGTRKGRSKWALRTGSSGHEIFACMF
jgi:hypothetical protein